MSWMQKETAQKTKITEAMEREGKKQAAGGKKSSEIVTLEQVKMFDRILHYEMKAVTCIKVSMKQH